MLKNVQSEPINLPTIKKWDDYLFKIRAAMRELTEGTKYAQIQPGCSDKMFEEKVIGHFERLDAALFLISEARQDLGI